MLSFDLNWLAIVICAVVNMVVNAIWFGVFANPWMEAVGLTRESIEGKNMGPAYGVALLNSLVSAFMLANVIGWADATTIGGGVAIGFFMWLGFTTLSFASNHAFELRSMKLWILNSGSYGVGLVVMGAILGAWQ